MKTLHELNSKMWYRLLKVFFILISIGSLLITCFTFYSNEYENKKIILNEKNQAVPCYTESDSDTEEEQRRNRIRLAAGMPLISKCSDLTSEERLAKDFPDIFLLEPSKFSPDLLLATAPYLLINVLVLIIIQRTFYYTVLGTVRPK